MISLSLSLVVHELINIMARHVILLWMGVSCGVFRRAPMPRGGASWGISSDTHTDRRHEKWMQGGRRRRGTTTPIRIYLGGLNFSWRSQFSRQGI